MTVDYILYKIANNYMQFISYSRKLTDKIRFSFILQEIHLLNPEAINL